jgi:superfamily II DNA or RNA helicase
MPSDGSAQPFLDVRGIAQLVGPQSFARGQDYASRGNVLELSWDADESTLTGRVRGNAPEPYLCRIHFPEDAAQNITSTCTCPVGGDCKHVAATLIRRNLLTVQQRIGAGMRWAEIGGDVHEEVVESSSRTGRVETRSAADPSDWKSALTALTTPRSSTGSAPTALTPMGLLFEVRELGAVRDRWRGASARLADVNTPASSDVRLAVRPVIRSGAGNWVRNTVNWGSIAYHTGRLRLNPDHQSWLGQLAALDKGTRGNFGFTEADWIYLDHISSPLLWPLLQTAADLGIALVGGKKGHPVVVGHAATIAVEITSATAARPDDEAGREPGSDLHVAPAVRIDGARQPLARTRLIGEHGLYSWTFDDSPTLTLAPTGGPITGEQRQLLKNTAPVIVPAADADEFLTQYFPKLRRTVAVSSPDESVALPAAPSATLVLTATFAAGDSLKLDWGWQYGPDKAPLTLTAGESGFRDPAAETVILQNAAAVGIAVAATSGTTLRGVDAAEFTEHRLPLIRDIDGVKVVVVGEQPEYRELTGAPALTVSTVETDQRDWFDLGVIITIDGKKVPFGPIFKALAKGANKLLLIDKSYLNLRQPVFDQLRDLILEAGDLDEWETGVRISRYQASLWSDFEELADETEQSIAWKESVAGLLALVDKEGVDPVPLPAGLNAELRPYQHDGFNWLAFLWQHGLGGVLADDMGLGKTVQTLALVAHAVESTPEEKRRPFLVVAPTSVVSNWVAEAAKFAPGLRVVGITETERKSRNSPAQSARDADLVITSYALFRLDIDGYKKVKWEGLVLDEAQFVKNPESKAHENAVELDAPFKLAITGTPMENSLTDLWALFRIVAPGLFPSARRFREDYLRPITSGSGLDKLVTLRRRIRPLMTRRTKELVAADLPAKQEQELRVDLVPEHRKLYDRFLQRERQKLLGLLADMNKNRFIVFRSLTLLRMLSLDASLLDEKYADIPSAKLDALLDHLDDITAEGHRALVFSQFTSFLGKAAERMKKAGIAYEYLDGSTTRRSEVIDRFRGGDAPVFLISLKAGGFGLNLTEADYVFLLDPWWNPAAEEQAVDRTHRIGQTRSVNVYRLVATGTIEEKVMALKEQKARLFDAVIDDDAMFSSSLTADDIRGLLD